MTRVKDIVDAPGLTYGRVVLHVFEITGGNDSDACSGVNPVKVKGRRVFHGTGIETRYLVVGPVGGDIGAGGQFFFNNGDIVAGYLVFRQPFEVSVIIPPDSGQNYRVFTQEGERIGNVAGGTPEFLDQAVDREADV